MSLPRDMNFWKATGTKGTSRANDSERAHPLLRSSAAYEYSSKIHTYGLTVHGYLAFMTISVYFMQNLTNWTSSLTSLTLPRERFTGCNETYYIETQNSGGSPVPNDIVRPSLP